MFLGTSLVYCLSDILDGTIDANDVFTIVSTNQFDISNRKEVVEWYQTAIIQYHVNSNKKNKIANYTEKEVIDLFSDLVHRGVIINRNHARMYHIASLKLRQDQYWYALCVVPDNMAPAVKEAWNYFKMIEKLCK